MSETQPFVSIIIPVFNRDVLIRDTLNSVKSQTYSHWECIIVDDFSTDHSFELIKQQVLDDKRFVVLTNQRKKGAPAARNIGVEHSKGDFLIFLDSDDQLTPDCLTDRVFKFQQNPDFDFLVFSTVEFKKRIDDTNVLLNIFTNENIIERFLNLDVPWLSTGPIWRRDSFLNTGGWNEDVMAWQDWELHIRALLKNYQFLYFSTIDNYLRRDDEVESIGTQSLSKEHLQSYLLLFEHIKPMMAGHPAYLNRLYGLAYWVAQQAQAKGYLDVAKKALNFLDPYLGIRFSLISRWKLFWAKKFYISNLKLPDFGTMRKMKV